MHSKGRAAFDPVQHCRDKAQAIERHYGSRMRSQIPPRISACMFKEFGLSVPSTIGNSARVDVTFILIYIMPVSDHYTGH